MAQHGINWRTVLAYAPTYSGRAERLVGTLKAAVRKTVLESVIELENALTQVLYGYRRRAMKNGVSPFESMYGVPLRIYLSTKTGESIIIHSLDHHRRLGLIAASVPRAIRSGASAHNSIGLASSYFFEQGERVLVAGGTAFGGTKWPAFVSKFYGSCRIQEGRYHRHLLESHHGRI